MGPISHTGRKTSRAARDRPEPKPRRNQTSRHDIAGASPERRPDGGATTTKNRGGSARRRAQQRASAAQRRSTASGQHAMIARPARVQAAPSGEPRRPAAAARV
ncbi:hypothetical protein F511_36063 [Dorcoceras hygrometricum]|uniref:Uncharacterized protein n=1 Tax=Dorcoceras hygrometricum TaxID=472368 RepID=A0A2Z7CZB7_9LAMI|nr:hypothetical protein F511_36063 [Dorcoceras hygrometricum]